MTSKDAQDSRRPARIIYGVTSPGTAYAFLRPQFERLIAQGIDVSVVSGPGPGAERLQQEGFSVRVLPLRRRNVGLDDILAFIRMVRCFRLERPDTVVMGTPKMALVGTIAALVAGVPRRIYMMHGLRLETCKGLQYVALWLIERVTAACATEVIAVSRSLRDRAISLSLASPEKIETVGFGSASGVNMARFRPPSPGERRAARMRFGLPPGDKVVCFVGRLQADKGIHDLLDAWRMLERSNSRCHLLIVGPDELGPSVAERLRQQLAKMSCVHQVGHIQDIEQAYFASDLLVLPSRREGLGMVVLEAAACNVPSVVYRATGLVDTVIDGCTGTIVPPGHLERMSGAIEYWLRSDEARKRAGEAARDLVRRRFEEEIVLTGMIDYVVAGSLGAE